MFEITHLTNVDASILIILLGALFLYFGRTIGETKIEKFDKLGYYIYGLKFSLFYIFVPFSLAFFSKDLFRVPALVFIIVQVLILICLLWAVIMYASKRYGIVNELKKRTKQELEQIREEDSYKGKLLKSIGYEAKDFKSDIFEYPIKLFGNAISLFIFSLTTILSSLWLSEEPSLLASVFSLVLTFYILTMVALAYGFGNVTYPIVKIYLVDGGTIEGRLLKFDDYVQLIRDDRMISINKDKINYIEESLFNERSD